MKMINLNEKAIDSTKKFTVICFEITNNCNKNCSNCSRMYDINRKIENMKFEDYKYVISYLTEKERKNFRKVIITGGEPILHPKFRELILLMRSDFPKAELNIQTNGRLIHKYLKILYGIKNIKYSVSYYPDWNDSIKKKFDSNVKLPSIIKRIIRKSTKNNKIIQLLSIDFRFPYMKKFRRFLKDPLKRNNVYFKCFSGFWNPYDDPNLSEERAKLVRKVCCYYIWIIGKKFYNCCNSAVYERNYDIGYVGIKFDENWKINFFKLPTYKACAHCRLGADRYKFINLETKLGFKKYEYISLDTRLKNTRVKNHV